MTTTQHIPPRSPQRRSAGIRGSRRFPPRQLFSLLLVSLPLILIAITSVFYAAGWTTSDTYAETVELFGENGGLLAFAATLAVTPIITVTGWRILRLRKWFGILTFVYGAIDGIRFIVERSAAEMLSEPFLIAGTVTLVLLTPLALTSNRRSIRLLGSRWRQLHKLTYVAAVGLLLHIALIPGEPTEIIVPLVLFLPSLVLRLPPVRDFFVARRTTTPRPVDSRSAR